MSSFAFASSNVVYADGDGAFDVLSAAGASALSVTSSVANLVPGIGYIPLLYGGGRAVDYSGLVIDPVNEVALGTMAVAAGAPQVTRTITLSPDGSRYYSVYTSQQGNTHLIQALRSRDARAHWLRDFHDARVQHLPERARALWRERARHDRG